MGTIEEIKNLQSQGKQESEIVQTLKQKGLQDKEISDALSQAKIKQAVTSPNVYPQTPSNPPIPSPQDSQSAPPTAQATQEVQGMEPSMLTQPPAQQEQQEPQIQDQYSEIPQDQFQPYDSSLQQYQEYQPSSFNPDTITEIADQIVTEKIDSLKDQIKSSKDTQNTLTTKLEVLEERLKRIEKIIDNLQSSILKKVGDYVTDVSDLKHELTETQKSFKALLPHKKH